MIFPSQASWISEVFPPWGSSRSGTIRTDLRDFFLSFRAPVCARNPSLRPRGRGRSNRSSSHGIHSRVCPSVDTSAHVHSQAALLPPVVRPLLHVRHVPSLWFLTTSTVYSALGPPVCCTWLPTGVRLLGTINRRPKSVASGRLATRHPRNHPVGSSALLRQHPLGRGLPATERRSAQK